MYNLKINAAVAAIIRNPFVWQLTWPHFVGAEFMQPEQNLNVTYF